MALCGVNFGQKVSSCTALRCFVLQAAGSQTKQKENEGLRKVSEEVLRHAVAMSQLVCVAGLASLRSHSAGPCRCVYSCRGVHSIVAGALNAADAALVTIGLHGRARGSGTLPQWAAVVRCGCGQSCCTAALHNLICLCALRCTTSRRRSRSDFCAA